MKTFGYILLLIGFVWLLRDAVTGLSEYQHSTTASIIDTKLLQPGKDPVRLKTAHDLLWELNDRLRPRYRMILLPGGLMLAGGLILGAQAQKRPIVKRIFGPPAPELKSKVEEVRRDFRTPKDSA